MNQKEMRRWKKALRSGEYEQGQGSLKVEEEERVISHRGLCCLGVYCEIRPGISWRFHNGDWHPVNEDSGKMLKSTFYLPRWLAKELDLHLKLEEGERSQVVAFLQKHGQRNKGRYFEGGIDRQRILAAFNDSLVPFPKIADFLEEIKWDRPRERK